MRYVDVTPTWEQILPTMLFALESLDEGESKDLIKKEFKRMAEAADKWNAHCKEQNNVNP